GDTQHHDVDDTAASSMSDAHGDAERDSDTSEDSVGSDDDENAAVGADDVFDTLFEFFRFIVSCNGGRGLTDESPTWLLSILNDPRCDVRQLQQWQTRRVVKQYGLSLLTGRRAYTRKGFRLPGYNHTFYVLCTNPVAATLEIFGDPENEDGFILFAGPVNSGAGRVYTTPATGTYWSEAQELLDILFGEGQVIAPVILSSDATVLSGNERVKVWALYLSLANVPLNKRWRDSGRVLLALLPLPRPDMSPEQKVELFQEALKIVLADLILASHT
ncbi:unnamed protein product, partial [Closterium sp. Naga37s-1]